ncbi:hypothetical protein GYMLUDRAFT_225673 [Collybiopsis luxurians FD-317 M1]|uniref:Uncharacterized protein n=1 Tax=Collybiopsis luxurians FD-317 M1 TaxID=944289 RepID=A0A0D0BYL9_9AGAR|nr:hypothetical protein GYMLUDRAFT_225673 [Collybiopsis luxurians FD-317 M1]
MPALRNNRGRPKTNFRRKKPLQAPSVELIAEFISNHNRQESCPLFYRVPPEVRNAIFLYTLLSYEDQSITYPNDAHYSRPDYRYSVRIDPRLLQTCRLIYLETRFLPVIAYEHTFWCHRAPPGVVHASDPQAYFERFTEEQRDHVDQVHFFTQQYYLEEDFPRICQLESIRSRSLKVTLRHGDWWFWEDNNPLQLKNGWADKLVHVKGLEEVILELETMERDKEQIYSIAERVRKETYPAQDG